MFCLLPAAPCSANTFFCHSNMCINNSLVCNGVQNCVYPWDENHCKGMINLCLLFTDEVIIIIHTFPCSALLHLLSFKSNFIFLFPPPPFSFLSPEKRSKGLFHQITKTHGTVIGVSSGIVLVLLIISILVQMKQPRKKVTQPFVVDLLFSSKAERVTREETHN